MAQHNLKNTEASNIQTPSLWYTAIFFDENWIPKYKDENGNILSYNTEWSEVNVLYVSKSWNDSNNGSNPTKAFLTIWAAISQAILETPWEDNRFEIRILWASTYTENLTIPSWIWVRAPTAKIIWNHTVADNSLLEAFRLNCLSWTCVSKSTWTWIASIICQRLILDDSSIGVVCSSWTISYSWLSVEILDWVWFWEGWNWYIEININTIQIIWVWKAITSLAWGKINIICWQIYDNWFWTAFELDWNWVIDAIVTEIDCDSAYDLQSTTSILSLVCSNLTWLETSIWTVNYTPNLKSYIVRDLNDFPQPVAWVITLEAGQTYTVIWTVNIWTNRIVMSEWSALWWQNPLGSILIYAWWWDMVSSVDVWVWLSSITLVSVWWTALNLSDTSKTKNIFINNILVANSWSVWTISWFNGIAISWLATQVTSDWLEIAWDSVWVSIVNYITWLSNLWTQLKINWIIRTLQIQWSRFEVDTWVKAIEVTALADITSWLLQWCFFYWDWTYVDWINIWENPERRFYGNKGIYNTIIVQPITNTEMANIAWPEVWSMFYNTDLDALVWWSEDWRCKIPIEIIKTQLFLEDWESWSFATNGWTVVNWTVNQWYVWTAEKYEGSYWAYISNDGWTSNSYTINKSRTVHFYKDIAIPAWATNISLSFKWKWVWEVSYDYLRVYNAPTTVTPVSWTLVDEQYAITGQLANKSLRQTEWAAIPDIQAWTTRRLIFTWNNDNSVWTQPPSCVDNILIEYAQS